MREGTPPMGNKSTGSKRKRGDGGCPNAFLVAGVRIFLFFYFLRFRLRIDRSALKGLKKPYILIANHGSNLDAFLIGRCLNPYHMNFVSSAFFYRFPLPRFLLGCMGAIPKSHSLKDLKALRMMMQSLSAGRILMVFPEGRRSMAGTGSRFSEAMAKFVKRSGVPVVAAHISGSYLAWPRWADHARPGPITIRFSRVLTPDELETASLQDIQERMLAALAFNDYEGIAKENNLTGSIQTDASASPLLAAQTPYEYRCKRPADNMHWLLHTCPDCLEELAMSGEGDRVRCTRCGALAQLLPTGALLRIAGKGNSWPTVPAWFNLQRKVLADKMEDESFVLMAQGQLSRTEAAPDSPMRPVSTGMACLSRKELTFTGAGAEGEKKVRFPIQDLDMLPVSLGESFELCDGDGVYWQVQPTQPEMVVRFEQYVDICLHPE